MKHVIETFIHLRIISLTVLFNFLLFIIDYTFEEQMQSMFKIVVGAKYLSSITTMTNIAKFIA